MSELGKPEGSRRRAPVWVEPQDEVADQVYDRLHAGDQDDVDPQDSVSVRGQVDEPMERRNHGATSTHGEVLLRKQAQRRTVRDGRSRIPYSVNRRPPSPDGQAQLRKQLTEERRDVQRTKLHQSKRSIGQPQHQPPRVYTEDKHTNGQRQPRSRIVEEDWQTVTHSNKRYRRPQEQEQSRQPISVQRRYEVLDDQDENMEETGYAMSEGSINTQGVRSRYHQGGGETS